MHINHLIISMLALTITSSWAMDKAIESMQRSLYQLCTFAAEEYQAGNYAALERTKKQMIMVENLCIEKLTTLFNNSPASLEQPDKDGFRPLMLAAMYGFNTVLENLLLKGANPSIIHPISPLKPRAIDLATPSRSPRSEKTRLQQHMRFYLQTPEGDRYSLCRKLLLKRKEGR